MVSVGQTVKHYYDSIKQLFLNHLILLNLRWNSANWISIHQGSGTTSISKLKQECILSRSL